MNGKKVTVVLLVLFLGFWMFTDPSSMASAAKGAGSSSWGMLTDGFRGLIRFLSEL